jgi:predicted nucleic acid-binding protein
LIDLTSLPDNALIDTGVFIRYLGDRQDQDSADCRAFCDAMIGERRALWVAAPTIAEVCRHRGKSIPRCSGITVVPFDDRAAEMLGLNIPMAKLHETKTTTGLSLTYLKYDAMIVACALRVRTLTIVSLDADHAVLAGNLGIAVRRPASYLKAQLALGLSTPAPSVALDKQAPGSLAERVAPSPPAAGAPVPPPMATRPVLPAPAPPPMAQAAPQVAPLQPAASPPEPASAAPELAEASATKLGSPKAT